ncbi:MAG: hypothetical protein EON59_06305 [Alphaproteobacteria bacterium]|nr:MAG: hypothetical protein EON59_06305 [Alphaproteobacteria bacterium]
MDTVDLAAVRTTLIGFTKRAEKATEESLVATFVDSAPLFSLLSTQNNQIIYGRRGTGKTHALKVVSEHVDQQGGIPVFLDMRTVGSNGSIYSDGARPLAERASVLLSDALSGLLNEFYAIALSAIDGHPHPEEITRRLDALQASISTVRITGDISEELTAGGTRAVERGTNLKLDATPPSVKVELANSRKEEITNQLSTRRSGRETIHLTFGSISSALVDMVAILGGKRIWFLIDEWSEVPVDLQPYLADLFRRVVLPVNEITVKIAAIEHRTDFAILKDRGEYIGLELGADVSADLNLDDFLVFDNSQEKAVDFIGHLIFRHYESSASDHPKFDSAEHLISSLFTQRPVFEEFVRAVEGVPRDALNLIAKVVTKAFGQQIAMNHVRAGARDWYNQDKAAVIRNDTALADLLQYIVSEVIGTRRARAFLLSSKTRYVGVDKLFDSRLLHILKKSVSSNDEPGERYDVFKIDYGCYVDLINTTRAPEGLFQEDDGSFTEVPKDDYRSIRRAILDPDKISSPA